MYDFMVNDEAQNHGQSQGRQAVETRGQTQSCRAQNLDILFPTYYIFSMVLTYFRFSLLSKTNKF